MARPELRRPTQAWTTCPVTGKRGWVTKDLARRSRRATPDRDPARRRRIRLYGVSHAPTHEEGEIRMKSTILGYNIDSPGGATNTLRGLTRSLDCSKEGLAVDATRKCSIDGCERPALTRGWCRAHYKRWRRHGDPMAGDRMRFKNPYDAIDALSVQDGECLVWTGSHNGQGYGRLRTGGEWLYTHRLNWERANGPIPDGMVIDHICHAPACLRLEHLRLATLQQNSWNLNGARSNSKTGYRNVYRGRFGTYNVQVRRDGRVISKSFRTLDQAIEAAAEIRAELFGGFHGHG